MRCTTPMIRRSLTLCPIYLAIIFNGLSKTVNSKGVSCHHNVEEGISKKRRDVG